MDALPQTVPTPEGKIQLASDLVDLGMLSVRALPSDNAGQDAGDGEEGDGGGDQGGD